MRDLHGTPSPDGFTELELVAREADVDLGGHTARMLTYGGTFPGPTLQLAEGQSVRILFRNELAEPTNLHLHGIPLPPEVDAPHRVVMPGESATYEFVVPRGSAGTHWYHPHLHGQVARQLAAGLAGAIVVRGPVDRRELSGASEHVLVLQDPTVADGRPQGPRGHDWMIGKEGPRALVNGADLPTIEASSGLVRLRLINASSARYHHLAFAGAEAHLAGVGGGLLDEPRKVESILLVPGDRADVLLRAGGPIELVSRPYSRGGGTVGDTGTLARIEATPTDEALPWRLAEVERLDPASVTATRRVIWGGAMAPLRFHVNGRPFDGKRIDFEASLGSTELWELVNPMRMDHPFHLHLHPFQVLDRDGVPEPFVAWRDTVNVRAGETVRILVPFRENAGVTMFHCHIAEHEDLGMMAHLAVR